MQRDGLLAGKTPSIFGSVAGIVIEVDEPGAFSGYILGNFIGEFMANTSTTPIGPTSLRHKSPGLWWLLNLGGWGLVALLTALQRQFMAQLWGKQVEFWEHLRWTLVDWWGWALLMPLVLWWGERHPLHTGSWKRHLPFLVGGSLVAVGAKLLAIGCLVYLDGGFIDGPTDYAGVMSVMVAKGFHQEMLVGWCILGAGMAVGAFRALQERELSTASLQSQLAQAQLSALKMQLHPHFLFNALHAISGLVRTGETKSAVKMIAGLSELLRQSLDNVGTQTVTLRRELELLQRYLEIEQIRFSDRLQVSMVVDENLLEVQVPNLILQPLVENAIRHGFAGRAEPGHIRIEVCTHPAGLRLAVVDDGPGVPPDFDMDRGRGVGLSNTRDRLGRLYGHAAQLRLRNVQPGLCVDITIPLVVPTL